MALYGPKHVALLTEYRYIINIVVFYGSFINLFYLSGGGDKYGS